MIQNGVFVLGRIPAIGLAELESLFGSDKIELLIDGVAVSDIDPNTIDFDRLGGVIKLGQYLGTINSGSWDEVQRQLPNFVTEFASKFGPGKIKLGLSVYGFQVRPAEVTSAGISIKKVLTKNGNSVRVIPNQEITLNSAQIIHNRLTKDRGIELLVVKAKNSAIIARTIKTQDINDYARRDQARPKRDARVGMLPPKLAQSIINIAVSSLPDNSTNTILDPFCGSGVVLQESLLMGYRAYGTDINEKMVSYCTQNIDWLNQHKQELPTSVIELADATNYKWTHEINAVASEGYLGLALTNWPPQEILSKNIHTCDQIFSKFLKNIAPQIKTNTRLCLALPAWLSPNSTQVLHLPSLDHIEILGYNRVSFSHTLASDLLYFRPGQLVARELVVLTKK